MKGRKSDDTETEETTEKDSEEDPKNTKKG